MSVKKIAITGHTKGIGEALADVYRSRGDAVVGLSRSNGYNIKLPKILQAIKECDVLINNAYDGFGQTELLYKVFEMWKNEPSKLIINISSALMCFPTSINKTQEEELYRSHKNSLEEAIKQLRMYEDGPRMMLVRPGTVATLSTDPVSYAEANQWAQSFIECVENIPSTLELTEITLTTANARPSVYMD